MKQIQDTIWMYKKVGHISRISFPIKKNLEKISQSNPENGFMIKWFKD